MLSMLLLGSLATNSVAKALPETRCALVGPGADMLELSLRSTSGGAYVASAVTGFPWPFAKQALSLSENGKGRYTSSPESDQFVADFFVKSKGLQRLTIYRGRGRNEAGSVPIFTGVCGTKLSKPAIFGPKQRAAQYFSQLIKVSNDCRLIKSTGAVSSFAIEFEMGPANSGQVKLKIFPKDKSTWIRPEVYQGLMMPMVVDGRNPKQWFGIWSGEDTSKPEKSVGLFRVNSDNQGSYSTLLEFDDFRSTALSDQNGASALCSEWAVSEIGDSK